MTLFKSKALDVVIDDVATSLHRASRNSATALAILYAVVRVDRSDVDLDSTISDLSRDVFRLREECYPARRLVKVANSLRKSEMSEAAYWASYTYLFSLLPLLVERQPVGKRRWSDYEYRRLEASCFTRWANTYDDVDDSFLFDGYNRVRAARWSWFKRHSKSVAANGWCQSNAVDQIEASFPQQVGSVRVKGFRYAAEEFVAVLSNAFKSDLAEYWHGAIAFGFLACDSKPLPSHIDKDSGSP